MMQNYSEQKIIKKGKTLYPKTLPDVSIDVSLFEKFHLLPCLDPR